MKFTTAIGIGLVALAVAACSGASSSGGNGSARAVPADSGAVPEGYPVSGPVEVPDSVSWNNPGVSPKQNRADLESCYGYAVGQVQHDIRIEDDRTAMRDNDLGIGYFELQQSMTDFDHQNRRLSLFEDCMISHGYTER